MSLILKLTKGSRYIDLTSGRYAPQESFVPPTSSISTLIASSTSANRYDSGEKIGVRLSPHGFGLPLQLIGNSGADISDAARILANFLAQAGDPVEPVYLEHRSEAALDAEPLWGQLGANMRFEIIGANVPVPAPIYSEGDMRIKHVPITVTLTLKPTGLGKKQRLASATGGVLEDTIGSPDGHSTGLRIPEDTTNLFTNPVFGYSTFDNGWTATGSLEATAATSSLFGKTAVRLIDDDSASGNTFTQSIDVGDTLDYYLTCYARMVDGTAVDPSFIELVYGTVKITTVTAVGNGWYRLSASVSGIASSQIVGVHVAKNSGVIVDGFQIEQNDYATPMCYGDMLGCVWSGAAHDSETARTVARVRVAAEDSIVSNAGSIRIIWIPDVDSTALSADIHICETTSSSISVRYDDSASSWVASFTGSGAPQTITVAATYSAGVAVSLVITFSPSGANVYVDGVLGGTLVGYVYQHPGDYLYIGSSNSIKESANGRFLDFSTYDVAMTAVQVADDTIIADGIVESGYRAGSIPWMWTIRGDGVVDNCDDSTHINYFVCGGITGNVEADTIVRFSPDDTENTYWIGSDVSKYGQFIHPAESQLFLDYSGIADAAYCGGEYEFFVPIGAWTKEFSVNEPNKLRGNTHVFVRLARDTAGSTSPIVHPYYRFGPIGAAITSGREKSITVTEVADLAYIGKVYIGYHKNLHTDDLSLFVGYGMDGISNVRLDYVMIINGRVLRITRAGLPTITSIFLNGAFAQGYSTAGMDTVFQTAGDEINVAPHLLNSIWFMSSDTNIITTTYTIESMEITPRYTTL